MTGIHASVFLRMAFGLLLILIFGVLTADRVFASTGQLTLQVEVGGGNQDVSCKHLSQSETIQNLALAKAIELLSCKNWAEITGQHNQIDVTVELGAGKYRLNSAVNLNWGSDAAQGRLNIRGRGRQNTIISGARELKDFHPVKDASVLGRLAPGARGKVLVADLKSAGLASPKPSVRRVFGSAPIPVSIELFFQGLAMKIASWPNEGWDRSRVDADQQSESLIRLGITGRNLVLWGDEQDIVVRGFFAEAWAEETIPVGKIDASTNTLVLSKPGPKFGVKNDKKLRIENVLRELDQPGEWYLDRKSGYIYFWPPYSIQSGIAEASVLDNLISIGNSRDVRITDLTLEMTRGDALKILNSNNVIISKSAIRNAGNRAVVISGGTNSGVDGVQISDAGEGGVVLRGGNRKTLTAANHFVRNSNITRFNRLLSTYRPGVQIDGVGNKVVANVIVDAPHSAIIFRGNDHLIAYNNISRVVTDTNDAGAIYTGRDWTARGTEIRNNFLSEIGKPGSRESHIMGIYLDDQASGISVTENIFSRVQNPVFLGGGRDNIIRDNLFVNSFPAVHLDARGTTWQKNKTDDPKWDLRRRLIAVPYTQSPYANKYSHLANILEDEPGAPKYNSFSRNMIIGPGYLDVKREAAAGISIEGTCHESEDIFIKTIPAESRKDINDFRFKQFSGPQNCRTDLPKLITNGVLKEHIN